MARKTDRPRVQNPPAGDGHHITSRYMTDSELAEREARQTAYDDMLARQQAYENSLIKQPRQPMPDAKGCVFAKSCQLPGGVINHVSRTGFIPVEKLADFGELSLLGGRERDTAGNIPLKKVGGRNFPATAGTLLLATTTTASPGASAVSGASAVTGGVVAGALLGMVALLWPSSLGDSSLYTEEQLKSLEKGRTRVRGGGRRSRWKDRKGRIYEWDSKTGAIELYNKQGKHLGEFNHETGEQIDPADPERSTPK
jgi:hypothetical protein